MASSPPAPGDGSGGGSPPPTCKSFRETKSWKEDPGGGAGSLQLPYKIVSKLMKYHQEALAELEEIELEKHWNHHINNLKRLNLFQSSLAVCDVRELDPGDSRHGRHVGIALSLLIAALCKPPFHGLVSSFSLHPELHAVTQPTLKEKVEYTREMFSQVQVNVQAVLDLVLNKAIAAKLAPEDMLKNIFIFTDMEFGQCGGEQYDRDYPLIQRKFAEHGFEIPGIIAWNLRGGPKPEPRTSNVQHVSGFSAQMIKSLLESGKVPSQ